jgi:hypothetical protein
MKYDTNGTGSAFFRLSGLFFGFGLRIGLVYPSNYVTERGVACLGVNPLAVLL